MFTANIIMGENVISETLTVVLLLVPDGLVLKILEAANLLRFSCTTVSVYTMPQNISIELWL